MNLTAESQDSNSHAVELEGITNLTENISTICILNGVLAMIDPIELTFRSRDDRTFITDILGNYYINTIPR